jgi:hypothetical protein
MPTADDSPLLVQLLVEQAKISGQLDVITVKLDSIPDHEQRIRALDAAVPARTSPASSRGDAHGPSLPPQASNAILQDGHIGMHSSQVSRLIGSRQLSPITSRTASPARAGNTIMLTAKL